jgi:hypothetical protein
MVCPTRNTARGASPFSLAETLLNIIRIQSGKVATEKRAQNEIAATGFGPSIDAEFLRIGNRDCFPDMLRDLCGNLLYVLACRVASRLRFASFARARPASRQV